jgi:hypothetical protein
MKAEYKCTECGGDATVAYVPGTIKRGKDKGKEIASWGGKIKPNERICLRCGRKRGLKFI